MLSEVPPQSCVLISDAVPSTVCGRVLRTSSTAYTAAHPCMHASVYEAAQSANDMHERARHAYVLVMNVTFSCSTCGSSSLCSDGGVAFGFIYHEVQNTPLNMFSGK